MWKLTQHKSEKGQQFARVSMLLKEMCNAYPTNSEEFEYHFKERIKEIPRTNCFSANLMFKTTSRNLKSVEVWKLSPQGEFKNKCFTLDFVE